MWNFYRCGKMDRKRLIIKYMKFAVKLKQILKDNPQIQHNRTKLRALFYIQKHNPKTTQFSIDNNYFGLTKVSLIDANDFGDHSVNTVTMPSFSSYKWIIPIIICWEVMIQWWVSLNDAIRADILSFQNLKIPVAVIIKKSKNPNEYPILLPYL